MFKKYEEYHDGFSILLIEDEVHYEHDQYYQHTCMN